MTTAWPRPQTKECARNEIEQPERSQSNQSQVSGKAQAIGNLLSFQPLYLSIRKKLHIIDPPTAYDLLLKRQNSQIPSLTMMKAAISLFIIFPT